VALSRNGRRLAWAELARHVILEEEWEHHRYALRDLALAACDL
jgi:hypothetical protein